MDPALPPGGLQRIMQQYDAIRSHASVSKEAAPWEPEEERGGVFAQNTPPQMEEGGVSSELTPPEADASSLKPKGDLSDKSPPSLTPLRTKERVELANRSRQQVLSDAVQPRPLGRPKSWQTNQIDRIRGEIGQRRFFHDLANPTRSSFKEDEVGLQKAYADATYPGVYYDPRTRTEYVKGTVPTNAKDWWDDISKIPVWGDIHDAERTKMAEAAYQKLIGEGKPVDRIVGHSLGGSVALQLQQDHDIPISRTFGAPVMHLDNSLRGTDLASHSARYRHPLDPFSVFDRGATMLPIADPNPHSFGGFSEEFDTPAPYFDAYLNPKKQTSFVV